MEKSCNWLNGMDSVEEIKHEVSMLSKVIHVNSMLYRPIIGPPVVYSSGFWVSTRSHSQMQKK